MTAEKNATETINEATGTAVDASANLLAQLAFLREVDKLKAVLRRSHLMDGSRQENSAEHSWHIAMAAVVLAEYSNAPVDITRVLKMLLVHDIVEIDAGDTFAFDQVGKASQSEREHVAAQRLFGLLPTAQAAEFKALWAEFEARETAESKFANAVDRLLPALHNLANQGGTWRTPGVHRGLINGRLQPIGEGAAAVWAYIEKLLDEAQLLEYFAPEP